MTNPNTERRHDIAAKIVAGIAINVIGELRNTNVFVKKTEIGIKTRATMIIR